jgi:metal-sulfur cluster biosynthetic enzyme
MPSRSLYGEVGDPTRQHQRRDVANEQQSFELRSHERADRSLGINIVDLGLVYDVKVSTDGGIDIEYTLTTMGCPIGPLIEDQMRTLLTNVPGVGEVRPEMVLRPPWSPEMMSDESKAALGIF